MSKAVEDLKVVQASTFVLFLKTWFFHWNVEGKNFYELHKLFNDIYDELFEAIDDISEHIRACDEYAPGTFDRFSELSVVDQQAKIPTAANMVQTLLADNTEVIKALRAAAKSAEAEQLEELVNFLGARLEAHTKHGWMLRATTKTNRE